MMFTDRFAYTARSVADREPGMVRWTMTIAPAVDSPIQSRDLATFSVRFSNQGTEARNQDMTLEIVRKLAAEIVGDIVSTAVTSTR